MVVGYCGAQIRAHLGPAARYIENPRFERTNSLYSLWLARDELMTGALVMNSDVLAPPLLFERLLRSTAPDAVLVERGEGFDAEDMKVMLRGDDVVDFGKGLPPEHAHAHNVGVAKFSETGGRRLANCLEGLVASGHENDWVPVAFREFASHWPLKAVTTDGLPWIEIDYGHDLTRARLDVQPAIVESRRRRVSRVKPCPMQSTPHTPVAGGRPVASSATTSWRSRARLDWGCWLSSCCR